MTSRVTARIFTCVLLVVSLLAPTLAIAASTAESSCASEIRALAAPSSMVLLTRSGARHDQARQRPSAPSICALVSTGGTRRDPGQFAAAGERYLTPPVWIADTRTGRSPPSIS